jgi:hypothetical protein
MKESMLAWLHDAGAWVWHASVALLVLLNVTAVLVVAVTRDRGLVNRWTGRWLGTNLGLIAFGVGAPMVTGLLRLALNAIPTFGSVAGSAAK